MRIFHCLAIRIGCGVCLLIGGLFVPVAVAADDLPLDEAGRLVRFHRDIAPIFRDHCLGCHGPEEEKAGFRIDDREFVLDYLVPEEPESSMLYTDYLASTDEDFLMPPKGHNDPLSPGELALVRVWIEEGADWPEDAKVTATKVTTVNGGAEVNAEAVGKEPVEATGPLEAPAAVTLPARVWAFQGYFHPAVIHFPIALLSVGGLFVIVGLKWPVMG
ncbi:MAG: c-type cytochrome domain-containing protein, partial [Pseudomonadales bacterium]